MPVTHESAIQQGSEIEIDELQVVHNAATKQFSFFHCYGTKISKAKNRKIELERRRRRIYNVKKNLRFGHSRGIRAPELDQLCRRSYLHEAERVRHLTQSR